MGEPIITFTSRSEWYGLPARDILEVARFASVRPVPRAPGIVAGLVEVHGRIVTLIDFDRLLASPSGSPLPGGFGVVLAPPYDHLGVLVSSEVDVAPAPEEGGGEAPEEAVAGEGLLRARLPIGERLLNVLALSALVDRVEQAIREGFLPAPGAGEEA